MCSIILSLCARTKSRKQEKAKRKQNSPRTDCSEEQEPDKGKFYCLLLHFIYFIDGLVQVINWKAAFMTKESAASVYRYIPNTGTWSVPSSIYVRCHLEHQGHCKSPLIEASLVVYMISSDISCAGSDPRREEA